MTNISYDIVEPKKEDLTSGGFTKHIQVKEGVTAAQLIKSGFTNHNKPTLYLCRMVGSNISFNLSIDKKTLAVKNIDVLSEDFLQPYDYQSVLMQGSKSKLAKTVFNNVDEILSDLQNQGLIVGYQRGMYI